MKLFEIIEILNTFSHSSPLSISFFTLSLRSALCPLTIYALRKNSYNDSLMPLRVFKPERPSLKPLLIPLIQIPVFVGVSLSLREIASSNLFNETFLNYCDPTLLSPLTIFGLSLGNTLLTTHKRTPLTKIFFLSISLLSFPVSMQVPMCISIFWLSSASFSLIQNALFNLRPVRQALGFPNQNLPPSAYIKYIKNHMKKV
jgi:membrane protein insertase Oxa1/YidC/SpoIIIJ